MAEAPVSGPCAAGGKRVKRAVISNGRKMLLFTLPDGSELHEEYDVITDELLLRRFRPRTTVGGFGAWETEVGLHNTAFVAERDLMTEAAGSPVLLRKDSAATIEFRIRNLPLPKDVFCVAVEAADPLSIVVRTTTKKYFKRIRIPELVRAGLPLEQESLSWEHERATLVITYRKPLFLLAQEAEDKKIRSSMRFTRVDDAKSAPAECAQQ